MKYLKNPALGPCLYGDGGKTLCSHGSFRAENETLRPCNTSEGGPARKGRWFTFPFPALCQEGGFLHRAPDVAGVSGYFAVCPSIPVQLLFWHAAMALLTDGNDTTHVPGTETNGIS